MKPLGRLLALALPCGLAAAAAADEPPARPPITEPVILGPMYRKPVEAPRMPVEPVYWQAPASPYFTPQPDRPRDPLDRPIEPARPTPPLPAVPAAPASYDEVLTGVPN